MLLFAKHPIRFVTPRTGLSPDVLRARERRHQMEEPSRSGGNRLAPRHGLKSRGLGARVLRDLEQFGAWRRSTR